MKLFDERVNSVAKYQYACIRMASSALWAFEDLHEKLKRLDFGRLSLISFITYFITEYFLLTTNVCILWIHRKTQSLISRTIHSINIKIRTVFSSNFK